MGLVQIRNNVTIGARDSVTFRARAKVRGLCRVTGRVSVWVKLRARMKIRARASAVIRFGSGSGLPWLGRALSSVEGLAGSGFAWVWGLAGFGA